MGKRFFLPLFILGLITLALSACSPSETAVPSALAAPNIFSGPVNGGCYLDTEAICRLHIDNWQPITADPGQKLVGFQLLAVPDGSASGALLYDFRSDVSNPPGGSYLPSLVKQDFAAQCGAAYQLSLRAKDTADLDFEEVGRTNMFQCPEEAVTPTATASVTPETTPSVTPTNTPPGTPAPGWEVYLPFVAE
jgi:hypothetical protein